MDSLPDQVSREIVERRPATIDVDSRGSSQIAIGENGLAAADGVTEYQLEARASGSATESRNDIRSHAWQARK